MKFESSRWKIWIGGFALTFFLLCAAGYTLFYRPFESRPSRFDVNDGSSIAHSTEQLIGSYPIEISEGRRFAWIGPSATIKLPFSGSENSLKISGWAPFSLHHDRNGVSELVIEVVANDRKLGEMHFDKDEPFEKSIELSDIAPQDGHITVKLRSESIIAPTEKDKRALGFVVTKIWLE